MKKYRLAEDVFKDKEIEEREKFKGMIVEDITDVTERIKERVLPKKLKRKFSLLKWMGGLLLFLFLLTMILGLIFLIKLFVGSIF